MVWKTSFALALMLAAVATIAAAQENSGPMTRPAHQLPGMIGFGMMGGLRAIGALADVNGDGALSLEEVEAASIRIFEAADADADGQLTAEEIGAFMDGGMAPASELGV
jgi:EF hand